MRVDWNGYSFTWMIGVSTSWIWLAKDWSFVKTRVQSPIKHKEQSNKGVASKASPMSTTLNIRIYIQVEMGKD